LAVYRCGFARYTPQISSGRRICLSWRPDSRFLSETEWRRIYERIAVRSVETKRKLNLYPQPVNLVFGRGLHFIALLEKEPQRQR
jgi:hypothetical protein